MFIKELRLEEIGVILCERISFVNIRIREIIRHTRAHTEFTHTLSLFLSPVYLSLIYSTFSAENISLKRKAYIYTRALCTRLCAAYLVLHVPGAVPRRQTPGLQTPILRRGNAKATGIGRFFRPVFLRFLLLISFGATGDFALAPDEGGRDSSVIASLGTSCSASCAISVIGISIFDFFELTFFGSAFDSFPASIDGLEFLSIFRPTSFFIDGVTFADNTVKSSSFSYFCFSWGNTVRLLFSMRTRGQENNSDAKNMLRIVECISILPSRRFRRISPRLSEARGTRL